MFSSVVTLQITPVSFTVGHVFFTELLCRNVALNFHDRSSCLTEHSMKHSIIGNYFCLQELLSMLLIATVDETH